MIDYLDKYSFAKVTVGKKAFKIGLLSLALLMPAITVFSQGAEPIIRTGIQEDLVYVYHTLPLAKGQGFNVYRSDFNNEFEKLNDRPIRGSQTIAGFLGEIGEYAQPMQQALEVENPRALYLRLKSSRMAANLATFYYPDVARALGHLYIDSTASIGQNVTYRIEVVDGQGKPSGKKIEQEVNLNKVKAPQPTNLKAEHNRRQVTLTWNYPESNIQNDDKIVRFNIYNREGERLERLNKNPIIRINNFSEFEQTFTIGRVGVTLNLIVQPVSLSMDEGPPSELLTYIVADQTPPSVVTGLQTYSKDNGEVELTWPVSTEVDAKGYNLFRAERIKGEYQKLNDTPISLLETFYVDRPPALQSTYFYKVSAIDSSGNESKRSNASKADVEDHVPPKAPISLNAEPTDEGTVSLSWEVGNPSADLKTYILLRKQLGRFSGKAPVQLNEDDFSGTTFVDKGEAGIDLAEGAQYQYQILAADSARNFSDTLSVTVKIPDNTPPEPPTRLTVENDNGIRALLRWNASSSTDVSRYLILRGVTKDSLNEYQTLSVKKRIFRDDSVAIGHTYFYAIAARDSLGNIGVPTAINEFEMKDFTPPRAVRNIRATLNNQKVEITWEPVPAADLKGYRLYVALSPAGVYEPVADSLFTRTETTVENLDKSSWIKVKAVDTSGNESSDPKPANIYVPETSSN